MYKYIRLIPVVLYVILLFPLVWLFNGLRRWIPGRLRYSLGRHIIKTINWFLGTKIIVQGRENLPKGGNVVLIGNHQSLYDPLVLIDVIPIPLRFISKKEVNKIWFVRDVANMIDIIYIDREDIRSQVSLMDRVKHMLIDQNENIIIYPEGTRTRKDNHEMLEFKPGSFKMALQAESQIVPIASFGSYKPLNPHYHQWNYRVDVVIFKPIPFSQFKDKTTIQISEEIHQLIEKQVEELRHHQKEYFLH